MLQGDASTASGPLSSLLVTLSFTSGSASITGYAQTDENGHWTLSIPAVELIERLYLEAGATGTIGDITLSAIATHNGTTVTTSRTISIAGPDPASPVLALSPDSLLFGLRPGDFRCVELTIANTGNASLKLSAIKGMALLPWMSVAVPAKLDLAPGEKITVNLYLAPPSDMVLPHAFSGSLLVEGTYGPEEEQETIVRELPFTVELSNPDLATLGFSVTGTGANLLAGALVTILHLESYASYRRASSAQGQAAFADIPTGEYLWFVTVAGYENALGTVQTGNLQAGTTVDVQMIPSTISIPQSIATTFTMTPSAEHCYEREPILLTLNLGSGIRALSDVASYLRVLDGNGTDVTDRFQIIPLALMAGTIPESGASSSKFLLIPLSNTAGDYTLKAIANVSLEGTRKSMTFTAGLEVRGPPELSITYFIPSTVEIGKNYRAGFELVNHGSAVEGLRMDYFYLALRSASWMTPAGCIMNSATITLTDQGMTAVLGALGQEDALRGYVMISSSSNCFSNSAAASVSILSSLGIPFRLQTATSAVKYLFHDGVILEAPREEEDASLISPAIASLPTHIFSWSTGEQTAVTTLRLESTHRPTFAESHLTLAIPDQCQGYVLSYFTDEWQGYEITGVTGGTGETVYENNYWRLAGSGFVLYCHKGPLTIAFAQDWEINAFSGPGFYMGNPQVVSLPYAWEVVTWQEERLVDYDFGQYVCDFWWGGWTFGEEGLNWEALKAQGERAMHVMCALVQTWASPDAEKTVTWFGFLADYDSYKSGSKAGRYNDTVSPSIAAGDDGTFLIVCEGYDDSRPSGKKKYLYMFLCDPANGQHCNTGGEYRNVHNDKIPEFDEVEGFDPRSPAVVWDPIRKAYHIIYLARSDADDFDYEVYRCGVRVKEDKERLDPESTVLSDRIVGEVFYQEGPEGGENGNCSSPFIAVCDHIETSLSSKQKALPHVVWAWEEIAEDGGHYIKLRAENYDLEPIKRRRPDDEGGGEEEEPSVYYMSVNGTNPRIAASMWDTVMVTWTSPDGQGSRSIKGRVFKTSTLRVPEFLKDEPEADCAGAFTIVDSGCGWQTELVSYRNGYFALIYCKNDDILWKLYDYEGNACLNGNSEKVNHSNGEGQKHVANRAPSVAGLPWYKNMVAAWACEDNGEYRIVLTVVTESETYKHIDDWYAGDGHVHSARPENTSWNTGPGNYYYSWLEEVYGGFQGRVNNCGVGSREFHGISILYPNPPSPTEQANGGAAVGLAWVILTEHGPMLGLCETGAKPTSKGDLWDLGGLADDYRKFLGTDVWAYERDHDLLGAQESLLALLGEEIGSAFPNMDGHLLAYGLVTYVPGGIGIPEKGPTGVPGEWPSYDAYAVDALRVQNPAAFGYIAHPAPELYPWWRQLFSDNGNPWRDYSLFDSDEYIQKGIVGLEILTDRNSCSGDDAAVWDKYLSKGLVLWGIGNSDGHWSYNAMVKVDIGKVGRNRTFTYCPGGLSNESLLAALQYGYTSFSDGIDFACFDGDIAKSHQLQGTTITLNTSAKLKDLKAYYGVGGEGEWDYEKDGVCKFIELPPPGTAEQGFYTYQIDLSGCLEEAKKGFIRFEGITVTGTKVFTQPLFLDNRMIKYQKVISGGYRESPDRYTEEYSLSETTGERELYDIRISISEFSDQFGNTIPSSAVAILNSFGHLGPNESNSFTVQFTLPEGTPEGVYYGTIEIIASDMNVPYKIFLPINTCVEVDWTAPSAPVLAPLSPVDVYSVPFRVRGLCDPLSFYKILVDGEPVAVGYSDAFGTIDCMICAGPGEHQVSAMSRDGHMNWSGSSNPIAVMCHQECPQVKLIEVISSSSSGRYVDVDEFLQEFMLFNSSVTYSIRDVALSCSDFFDALGNKISSSACTLLGLPATMMPLETLSALIHLSLPEDICDGLYTGQLSGTALNSLTGELVAFQQVVSICLDRTPPAPPVIQPLDGSEIGVLPLQISGSSEPCAYVQIFVDGIESCSVPSDSEGLFTSWVTMSQGEHQITARARDRYNWSESSSPLVVTSLLDGAPPSSSLLFWSELILGEHWASSEATVYIYAEDEDGGSGVSYIEYSLDFGATWHDYTDAFEVTGPATATVLYRAVDNAGNREPARTDWISFDCDEPTAALVSPTNGSVLTESSPVLGIAADENFLRYEVFLGKSVTDDYIDWLRIMVGYSESSEARVVCDIDPSQYADGLYSLMLIVTDGAGRSSRSAIDIIIQTRPLILDISPEWGRPGEEVIIYGENFGSERGSSVVLVGGIPITDYTSWSDGVVVAVIPDLACGMVNVVVTTSTGTSEARSFTVQADTILTLTLPESMCYSESSWIKARLTDWQGRPLGGEVVSILLSGTEAVLTTDDEGLAKWEFSVSMAAGIHSVIAVFGGGLFYTPSVATGSVEVLRETLQLSYSGDTKVNATSDIHLCVDVSDPDGNTGGFLDSQLVIFRILDSFGNQIVQVHAPIAMQGQVGRAEAVVAHLPVGLYTVRTFIEDNPHYVEAQVLSTELVVYSSLAGLLQGVGVSFDGGLWVFSLNVKYKNSGSTEPAGRFVLTDFSCPSRPRTVIATSFSYLVIPAGQQIAHAAGACTFNGQSGYTFVLEVHDLDDRVLNSTDRIILRVFNEVSFEVYMVDFAVSAGEIKIKR